MAVEKFNLKSLAEIDDGRLRKAWEQALNRARLDCEDRPSVEKARTVTLTIELVPVREPGGSLHSVDASFRVRDKLPEIQSPAYSLRAGRGGLFYNELSLDDVNQMTLDEVGPRTYDDDSADERKEESNAG